MSKKKSKEVSYLEKFNIKCDPSCIFFPNVICEPGDWVYDEEKHYKIRKEPKVYRCTYDSHVIAWDIDCPRLNDLNNK